MSRLSARIATAVLAAGLAAGLSACAPAAEPPPSAVVPESKIPPPQSPPAAQAPAEAPTVTAALTPPPVQAAPETPAWAPPVPGPKHLLGLDGGRVSQLLGPPDFRRRDNPAEIWQYRSAACVLDLFLYGKQGGAGGRVTHVEMRDLGTPAVPEADCLRALFKDRPRTGG